MSNKSFANVPWMELGYGATFGVGVVESKFFSGKLVRIKAIGATKIRIANHMDSEVVMTDGERDYFFIPEELKIEVIEGSINIMK